MQAWSGMSFEEIQNFADELMKNKDIDTSAYLYFGDVIILISNLAARLKGRQQPKTEKTKKEEVKNMRVKCANCGMIYDINPTAMDWSSEYERLHCAQCPRCKSNAKDVVSRTEYKKLD